MKKTGLIILFLSGIVFLTQIAFCNNLIALCDGKVVGDSYIIKNKVSDKSIHISKTGNYDNDIYGYDETTEHATNIIYMLNKTTSPNTKILLIANNEEENAKLYNIEYPIKYAVENGAKAFVICTAFYQLFTDDEYNPNDEYNETIIGKINDLAKKYPQCLFCISAGNHNRRIDFIKSVEEKSDNLLIVGSINEKEEKSSFSNYGDFVDVYTYGEKIITMSHNHDMVMSEGTSYSAPIIASGYIKMLEINPNLTPKEFADMVRSAKKMYLDWKMYINILFDKNDLEKDIIGGSKGVKRYGK